MTLRTLSWTIALTTIVSFPGDVPNHSKWKSFIRLGPSRSCWLDTLSSTTDNGLLSHTLWIILSGAIVLILSLTPSLSDVWQLTFMGTLMVVAAVISFLVGASLSIDSGSQGDVDYGRPTMEGSSELCFPFRGMSSFGIVTFLLSGHLLVLPNLQASLVYQYHQQYCGQEKLSTDNSTKKYTATSWCRQHHIYSRSSNPLRRKVIKEPAIINYLIVFHRVSTSCIALVINRQGNNIMKPVGW